MLRPTQSEFDRLVYILASVCHIKDHAAHSPSTCNDVEKKHIGLLNYIALLLVTKSRGDVAAVTMEIKTSAINFYYAKNLPCDPSAKVYIERILSVLRENELNTIPRSVLMIVMVECVDKVRNRICKCQKALEESEKLGISSLDLLSGSTYDTLLKPWAGLKDSEVLRSFFYELRSFDTSILTMRSQPVTSMQISQKARVIGTVTLRLLTRTTALLIQSYIGAGKALIQYPNLHRQIQKLGDYVAAVMKIKYLLERPEYYKLVSNIRVIEVSVLISSLYITIAPQRGLKSANY